MGQTDSMLLPVRDQHLQKSVFDFFISLLWISWFKRAWSYIYLFIYFSIVTFITEKWQLILLEPDFLSDLGLPILVPEAHSYHRIFCSTCPVGLPSKATPPSFCRTNQHGDQRWCLAANQLSLLLKLTAGSLAVLSACLWGGILHWTFPHKLQTGSVLWIQSAVMNVGRLVNPIDGQPRGIASEETTVSRMTMTECFPSWRLTKQTLQYRCTVQRSLPP